MRKLNIKLLVAVTYRVILLTIYLLKQCVEYRDAPDARLYRQTYQKLRFMSIAIPSNALSTQARR